jgi:transglutaminase-like putative cysteine protease
VKALAPLLLALIAAISLGAAAEERRMFGFEYSTQIGPLPETGEPVDIFIPIAQDGAEQEVLALDVQASVEGEFKFEPKYGNRFWHAHIDRAAGQTVKVTVEYSVSRRAVSIPDIDERHMLELSRDERVILARFLEPNDQVPVKDPVLTPILADIQLAVGKANPARTARAIYDWVVDNMEYKKVGSGWGQGNTYWACSERYGNCTDFHSLFISLARNQGIPARFEMGFPVPEDKDRGKIGGYHCWLQFYLPEIGWVTIDASEASKHPEKKEFLFGNQSSDRLRMSLGRDLRLGNDHSGPALNYFVYPYVEIGDEPFTGPVEKSFAYRDF